MGLELIGIRIEDDSPCFPIRKISKNHLEMFDFIDDLWQFEYLPEDNLCVEVHGR